MKQKKGMTLMQKRAITGLLFISPWLIGFIVFYVRSIYMTGMYSLCDVSTQVGSSPVWAGLAHYKATLVDSSKFSQEMVTSVGNMLVDVPLITAFSLLMAIMLNSKFKGRTLVRAIFFLPVILNSEAIVSAMDAASRAMANGLGSVSADAMEQVTQSTTINVDYYMAIFRTLGMPATLLDYVTSAADRISGIVSASGVQIVIFIAALQSISPALYEVANIEGATAYETFWKVTLPMVSPLIVTNVVYTVVDGFTSSTVVELTKRTIFTEYNWSDGSVMSLLSTLIVCLILAVVCWIISKFTFYYN